MAFDKLVHPIFHDPAPDSPAPSGPGAEHAATPTTPALDQAQATPPRSEIPANPVHSTPPGSNPPGSNAAGSNAPGSNATGSNAAPAPAATPPTATAPSEAPTLEQLAHLQAQLDALRAGLAHAHRLSTLGTLAAIVAHEYNNILTPIISYAQLALGSDGTPETPTPPGTSAPGTLGTSVNSRATRANPAHTPPSTRHTPPSTTSEDWCGAGATSGGGGATSGGASGGGDPELTRKALRKIIQGAERASQISASLLGFAREATGQTTADLRQTIDDALAALVRDPAKDGIRVHIDVPDATVAMAPVSLQQVLVNLMLNAVKAMRPRGGRLVIRAQQDPDTQNLTLDVTDTGPGIPAHIRRTLFDPFVTTGHGPNTRIAETAGNAGTVDTPNDAHPANPAHSPPSTLHTPPSGGTTSGGGGATSGGGGATSGGGGATSGGGGATSGGGGATSGGGTGLGLCVCRELIQAAGGQITFTTHEGQGTTFHLTLPLIEAAPGSAAPAPATVTAEPPTTPEANRAAA